MVADDFLAEALDEIEQVDGWLDEFEPLPERWTPHYAAYYSKALAELDALYPDGPEIVPPATRFERVAAWCRAYDGLVTFVPLALALVLVAVLVAVGDSDSRIPTRGAAPRSTTTAPLSTAAAAPTTTTAEAERARWALSPESARSFTLDAWVGMTGSPAYFAAYEEKFMAAAADVVTLRWYCIAADEDYSILLDAMSRALAAMRDQMLGDDAYEGLDPHEFSFGLSTMVAAEAVRFCPQHRVMIEQAVAATRD